MSDYDRAIEFFNSMGIGFKEGVHYNEIDKSIWLDDGCKNVEGYNGFYSEFIFDKDGKFKNVGIFE